LADHAEAFQLAHAVCHAFGWTAVLPDDDEGSCAATAAKHSKGSTRHSMVDQGDRSIPAQISWWTKALDVAAARPNHDLRLAAAQHRQLNFVRRYETLRIPRIAADVRAD
jgi:hypothetical protein